MPENNQPPVLFLLLPDLVIVKHDHLTGEKQEKDWWMGQVTHFNGAVHDPKIHNLFTSLMWIQE